MTFESPTHVRLLNSLLSLSLPVPSLFLSLSLLPFPLSPPLSLPPPSLSLPPQQANWMCPSCVQAVKAEEEKQKQRVNSKEGGTGGCNCDACVAKR